MRVRRENSQSSLNKIEMDLDVNLYGERTQVRTLLHP